MTLSRRSLLRSLLAAPIAGLMATCYARVGIESTPTPPQPGNAKLAEADPDHTTVRWSQIGTVPATKTSIRKAKRLKPRFVVAGETFYYDS